MNLRIISFCVVLIIVLSIISLSVWNKYQTAVQERDQVIQFSLAQGDSIHQMSTKLGQASARSRLQDLTVSNLRRLQHQKDLAWLKQIEGINKRMNNVEQISTTTARLMTTFSTGLRDTTVSVPLDSGGVVRTIPARAFDNKNKWISLKGLVMPDTLIVTPIVNVPLQSVVYWQRKRSRLLWFRIGRKEWFKQTTSENPYVTITEDKLIQVSKKPKNRNR